MAIEYAIGVVIAKAVLAALEKRLVYRAMYNEDYTGDATSGTVRLIGVTGATVAPYTRNQEVVYGLLSDTPVDLDLDQSDIFACRIDDLDKIQSSPDLLAAALRDGVHGLENAIDKYLAQTLADGAELFVLDSDDAPVSINSANALPALTRMGRLLDDADVPREGRSVVLPPWYIEDLVTAEVDLKVDLAAFQGGYVGRAAGFDIRMSTNVPKESDAHCVIGGTKAAATMALQLNQVEKIRLEKYVADGIRGLTSYGAVVVYSVENGQ
jgi:hypothetical protein